MARPTQDDIAFARRHRRDQAKRSGRAGGSLVGIRVAEIERLFTDRYGETLPDDDAGRDDLVVLLNHAAWFTEADTRMRAAAARWAPWMSADELDDKITDIRARPLRWRADKLAERLGVDDATRTRLELRTIGATDVTVEQRRQRRRERDRLAKEAKRREQQELVPVRAVRPGTLRHRSPWRAEGISRSTWYWRRRRNRTPASTAYTSLYAADAGCPTQKETLQ